MKRLNRITAAESDESRLSAIIDELKDEFDYIISGLEKLDRSGSELGNNGLAIAESLMDTFMQIESDIASNI